MRQRDNSKDAVAGCRVKRRNTMRGRLEQGRRGGASLTCLRGVSGNSSKDEYF